MTGETTLPEFLLARIAEDESVATAAGHGCGYLHEHNAGWVEVDLPDAHNTRPSYEMRFIGRFDPDRVLAECKAKRRIVNAHEGSDSLVARWYMGVLALPYADHVDYRKEWRP